MRSLEQGKSAVFNRVVSTLMLFALLTLTAAHSSPAQFGGLRKLANKVRGTSDSTAAKDSTKNGKDTTKVAADSSRADTTKTKGRSLFSRAASAASKASDKIQQTTGLSATDVALAATGVGAAGVIAKHVAGADGGTGPGLVSSLSRSVSAASQVAVPVAPAATAPASVAQSSSALAVSSIDPTSFANAIGSTRMSTPDQKLLLAFQQQMLDVAKKASDGDAPSRARLDAWQAIVLRNQNEIVLATQAAGAGDKAAAAKLQQLQLKIIREWMNGASRPMAKKP